MVDLGCGSGRWARELNRAGYEVYGVDQSPAMIRLARRVAPASQFKVGSFLAVPLPACVAITSTGECLNYCFDPANSRSALVRLFRRAYRALRPGGVFVFDIASPDRLGKSTPQENWSEGRDWAVMSSIAPLGRDGASRRITAFRRIGRLYRRSEEWHRLRLYRAADLIEDLNRCGFQARALNRYGRFRLPRGIHAILAIKPSP